MKRKSLASPKSGGVPGQIGKGKRGGYGPSEGRGEKRMLELLHVVNLENGEKKKSNQTNPKFTPPKPKTDLFVYCPSGGYGHDLPIPEGTHHEKRWGLDPRGNK